MPDEPVPDDAAGLRAADARLRAVVGAKDEQVTALTAALEASLERERRLELRLAEVERRPGMDSTDSGAPSSKERTGAKEARRARQQSERERSKDRKRGGQPGHQGKGLKRDPDPGEKKDVPPPVECRSCRAPLDGAEAVEPRWAQVIDVEFARKVTEWALPGLSCPCCGAVTFAEPPAGARQGSVSCGPALNAAAVLLSCYGNVPPERAARVIAMLLGVPVSAGFVDEAAARVSAQLGRAGLEEAMLAALAAGDVPAADETPVNVLDRTAPTPAPAEKDEADPEEKDGKAAAGAPHALITRTPDGRSRNSAPAACRTGWATSSPSSATPMPPLRPPVPAGTPPWTSSCSMTCANATTPPSPPGSSTTGCGTGTQGITPATHPAPGCGTTRNRSSRSPANPP